MHGAARVVGLGRFAQGVADGFSGTLLPEALAYAFAAGVIVPGEIAVGLLLVLGLFIGYNRFSLDAWLRGRRS